MLNATVPQTKTCPECDSEIDEFDRCIAQCRARAEVMFADFDNYQDEEVCHEAV